MKHKLEAQLFSALFINHLISFFIYSIELYAFQRVMLFTMDPYQILRIIFSRISDLTCLSTIILLII